MLNVAVFGSGRGSNFKAILSAIQQGTLQGVVLRFVLSNNSTSGILEIARTHRIPALHLSQKQFPTEQDYIDALDRVLREYAIDGIVLAGYMKCIPAQIVERYRGRIINIHPALLPKFGGPGMYGMHVHEAVIAAGEKESGATVHYVDEHYDHGDILLQQRIPVLPDDTPASLASRVLDVEHVLFPRAMQLFAARVAALQAASV